MYLTHTIIMSVALSDSSNAFAIVYFRHGLDSNVLRFVCRLDTSKPIDIDRRFILSYFLSDDTISVFEPPVRNSGKLLQVAVY